MKTLLFIFLACHFVSGAEKEEERVVLYTTLGQLSIVLEPTKTPRAGAYFKRLVQNGVYDHTKITFLQKGNFVQVGTIYDRKTPLSSAQQKLIHPVKEEISDLPNQFGTIAFTQTDEKPNSAETAFTIFTGDFSNLNGKNTVLGRIENGTKILRLLESSPANKVMEPTAFLEVERAELLDAQTAAEIARRSEEVYLGQERSRASSYALFLILGISLVTFFLKQRLSPRMQVTLALLVAFIAAFAVFFSITPMVVGSPWVGIFVFASMIGLYKLMNRFESAY